MTRLLITCEHGGNRIPAPWRHAFAGEEALLASHRGYDPGALALARDLARAFDAPLVQARVSRLLVDLNRSPGHPRLHGEAIRRLPAASRRLIVQRHYLPFRSRVEALIAGVLAAGDRVVHVSSHSFTPELDGVVRDADVGLLYDPARAGERALAGRWCGELLAADARLRVRRNYPYRGTSDGFTAWLRRRFPADRYVGLELEVNQRWPLAGGVRWRRLRALLVATLDRALDRGR